MSKKSKSKKEFITRLEQKALWRLFKVFLIVIGAIASVSLAFSTVSAIYSYDSRTEPIGNCSVGGTFSFLRCGPNEVIEHEPHPQVIYIVYFIFLLTLYLLIAYVLFMILRRIAAYILLEPHESTNSPNKEE